MFKENKELTDEVIDMDAVILILLLKLNFRCIEQHPPRVNFQNRKARTRSQSDEALVL